MTSADTIVEKAKARFNHNEARIYLKEKYTNLLQLVHMNGMFTVTVELIAFLRTPSNDTEYVIIVDDYGNPIQVNREKLLEEAQEHYSMVMAHWLEEHTQLAETRQ
jgi:hypothetical protein